MAERSLDPACEQCGYLLSGHRGRAVKCVCPECGTTFEPSKPWLREAWPAWTWVAFSLCGPLVVVVAALLAVSASRGVRNWVVWPLWSVWLIGLITFGLFWPLGMAKTLAKKCEPIISRRAAAWRVAAPALGLNAVFTAVGLLAFFLML